MRQRCLLGVAMAVSQPMRGVMTAIATMAMVAVPHALWKMAGNAVASAVSPHNVAMARRLAASAATMATPTAAMVVRASAPKSRAMRVRGLAGPVTQRCAETALPKARSNATMATTI